MKTSEFAHLSLQSFRLLKFLLTILLFVSLPVNAQWIAIGAGSSIGGDIMDIMEHNNVLYAGGTAYLFRSTDLGSTWEGYFELFAYAWSLAKQNNTLYCGLWNSSGQTAGVYKSTHNGSDWTTTPLSEPINSLAASDSEVFASTTNGKIFLTTDEGQSWNLVTTGMYSELFLDVNNLYAAGTGLKLSTNNGANWNLINSDVGFSVFAEDSLVFFGTQGGKIYRSGNYGQNWITVFNKPGAYIYSLFKYNNLVFAGTDSGLFISNDYGFSFEHKNENLGRTRVADMMYYNGDIYLANSNYAEVPVSVWKRPVSELTSVNENISTLPEKIELLQNFPNPFNNSTRIYFKVPESFVSSGRENLVTLKVFDITGNEVAELFEGSPSSANNYLDFDASSLSSGVYFLRLTAVGKNDKVFNDSKKMLLLK
ncbi:MAG: T9SS type A sorting domain-containing protein [Ignavibacterium sp.]